MLPEEQESGQKRIIKENNPSLSYNIQAELIKWQEQNYVDFRIIAESLLMNQGEVKL